MSIFSRFSGRSEISQPVETNKNEWKKFLDKDEVKQYEKANKFSNFDILVGGCSPLNVALGVGILASTLNPVLGVGIVLAGAGGIISTFSKAARNGGTREELQLKALERATSSPTASAPKPQ